MMSAISPSVPIEFNRHERLLGIRFMVLASLFWAILELTGLAIPRGYSALQTVWMRYGVQLLFMLAVFFPQRANLVRTNMLSLQIIRPFLMIGMPIFYVLGLKFMSTSDVWTLFWVTPLTIMILGTVLLGEKVSLPQWVIGAIGLIGVVLILHPDRTVLSWSAIFPLGMAFCFSLYQIMTRMLRAERTITNLFYTALVVFLPWSLGLPHFWKELTMQALVAMTMIGLIGYVTLYFLDKAYEHAPPSMLAPFTYTQPIFLLIISSLLLRHTPSLSMFAGALILVGSIVYLFFYENNIVLS